jgi:photosynthetic reaction center cytochrome c subunit
MLRSVYATSIFLVTMVTATAAAAQPPAAAGVSRPKLQVLQALPESQLFPLMNLVATSLGVQCDYCHVQDAPNLARTPSNVGGWLWDRDDKPQKRTAREMMRMVIELNAGRFKGESRITCYTCHRGSSQPARVPPLPPPPAGTATTAVTLPLPSGDRVWAAYLDAVGRADRASPGTGTIISGWDDRPEGRYGKVEIVVAGPDRYRATLTMPDTTSSQGLDGDTGWVATNDRVQRVSGNDVGRLRRLAMRYSAVKERPANLQVVGVERLADGDAYVATARIDPITTRTLFFDVVTGLLRREMTTTETLLVPLQEQVEYDEYRDVGGVRMPFRVRTSDGAPYGTVTRTFLQIRRDVTIDDTLFRPPLGIR